MRDITLVILFRVFFVFERMEFGTNRVKSALKKLGNPEKDFKIVHVSGTNGKGTVTKLLSSVMSKSQVSNGTFTSPFVTHPRDSICINGSPITLQQWETVQGKCDGDDSLTSFERLFVASLLAFKVNNVEFAIIECGMGGLLDATNAIDFCDKLLCIICSISLDHKEFLGQTIRDIARHKAGIVGPGNTCVVSESACNAGILDYLPKTDSKLILAKNDSVFWKGFNHDKCELGVPRESEYYLADLGVSVIAPSLAHSSFAINAGIAVKALIELSLIWNIKWNFMEGFKWFSHPGRGNVVSFNKSSVILDGCHNEESVNALLQWSSDILALKNREIHLVIAFSKSLDESCLLANMLIKGIASKGIALPTSSVHVTEFRQPLGMTWIKAASATAIAERLELSQCGVSKSIESAFKNIPQGSIVLVCGSLYLISDFYRYMEEKENL